MAALVDAFTSPVKEPKVSLARLDELLDRKDSQIIEILRMQTELAIRAVELRRERQNEERWVSDVPLRDLCEDDDVIAFLHTAERVMSNRSVQPEQWAEVIAPYLTGKARQAYRALGDDERTSYAEVKQAILRRYKLPVGTYRCLFKEEVEEKAARVARWEAIEKQAAATAAEVGQVFDEAVAERRALRELVRQAAAEEAEAERRQALNEAAERQTAAREAAERQTAAREAAEQAAAREAAEQAAAREAAEQAAAREVAERQVAREAAKEEARVAEEAVANEEKSAAVAALSATEAAAVTNEAEAATTDAATRETFATEIVAASKVAGIEDVAASNGSAAAREAAVPARAAKIVIISDAKGMATLASAPVATTMPDMGLGTRAAPSDAAMWNQNASVTAFVTEAEPVARAMASGAAKLLAKTCHSAVKKPALAPRRQPAVT